MIITASTQVPWVKIESSNLEGYHYDEATQNLYMKFLKGKSFYVYAGVSPELVEGFKAAESHGKFFIANIREQHSFQKFDVEVV